MDSKKCVYCGRSDVDLVEYGDHAAFNKVDGKYILPWLCADGQGCQSRYQHTWKSYFRATLIYDVPFFVFGVIVMTACHIILMPTVYAVLPDFTVAASTVERVLYGLLIFLLIMLAGVMEIPSFISPVLLTFFLAWLTW